MIDGFKLDFTSDQLKAHCEVKSAAHREKVARYQEQLNGLHRLQQDQPGLSNDPGTALQRQLDSHVGRASFFDLLAGHIVPNETYRLGDSDLQRLELIDRGWF